MKTKSNSTQQGVFCYAGFRIYTDRHLAYELQSQLNEHNRALEYTISFLSFDQEQYQAEVTQTISTAESPVRWLQF